MVRRLLAFLSPRRASKLIEPWHSSGCDQPEDLDENDGRHGQSSERRSVHPHHSSRHGRALFRISLHSTLSPSARFTLHASGPGGVLLVRVADDWLPLVLPSLQSLSYGPEVRVSKLKDPDRSKLPSLSLRSLRSSCLAFHLVQTRGIWGSAGERCDKKGQVLALVCVLYIISSMSRGHAKWSILCLSGALG